MHSSKSWRAVYAVCIFLAIAYVFFDVLDLDGSNFPRLQKPVARSIVLAEVIPSPELIESRETALPWANMGRPLAETSTEFKILRQTPSLGFTALEWVHYHGLQVSSPRKPASNIFPDH